MISRKQIDKFLEDFEEPAADSALAFAIGIGAACVLVPLIIWLTPSAYGR